MQTLSQLLGSKAPEIHAVAPGDSVLDAIRLMAKKGIGAVLVMEGARLVGIVSERDYARKVVLHGRSSSDTAVREIMTAEVVTVSLHDSVEGCMQVVTDSRIRHLPVMDREEVVGVISIGDLVKAVIEDQKVQLDQLQRYIAS
ncbi:MAG: CBS domain-containing protein [Lysobacteraceae bacterium]|jgi:CBS domain-containing protein|nr:MAG: CBS domain-containing protein [Xanthomonadaceae bacterium]